MLKKSLVLWEILRSIWEMGLQGIEFRNVDDLKYLHGYDLKVTAFTS